MERLALIGCVALGIAVVAVPSSAQVAGPAVPSTDGRADPWPRGQIGAEIGVHTQEGFTAESFLLGGWYRITPSFALEGTIGIFNASSDREKETSPASPFIAGYYVGSTDRTMYRVGAGLAAGVGSLDETAAIQAFMRGFRDLWLVLPDSVNLVPRFRLDTIVSPQVVIGVDVDLAVHVPTERRGESEVTGQVGVDLTARAGSVFQAGLRLQGGGLLTAEDAEDAFQSSLVPFMRLVFGEGYVDARLLVNLDEPAGFGFDEGKIWTFYLGGGWIGGSDAAPAPGSAWSPSPAPPWQPPQQLPPRPPEQAPPPTAPSVDQIFVRNLQARREAILACTSGAPADVVGAYSADGTVTVSLAGALSGSPAEGCVRSAIGPMILDTHGTNGVARYAVTAEPATPAPDPTTTAIPPPPAP